MLELRQRRAQARKIGRTRRIAARLKCNAVNLCLDGGIKARMIGRDNYAGNNGPVGKGNQRQNTNRLLRLLHILTA